MCRRPAQVGLAPAVFFENAVSPAVTPLLHCAAAVPSTLISYGSGSRLDPAGVRLLRETVTRCRCAGEAAPQPCAAAVFLTTKNGLGAGELAFWSKCSYSLALSVFLCREARAFWRSVSSTECERGTLDRDWRLEHQHTKGPVGLSSKIRKFSQDFSGFCFFPEPVAK